jgi:cytoskeletal protein CcmA (bactofilin family)
MTSKDSGNKPPQPISPAQKTSQLDLDAAAEFKELEKAGKRGLLGRFNAKFNDALQSGRAPESAPNAVAETTRMPAATIDDIAMRRARNVGSQKMVIPEGVIIEGSLTGNSDTEISGRIDGNITVEGALHLGPGALVSGNVRAGTCRIDGLVEGKVESSGDLELGPNGRLNADLIGGRNVRIAGQVYGNITTPGALTLAANSKVTGDVCVRRLIIEEGATLEGQCTMRAPAQRSENSTQ